MNNIIPPKLQKGDSVRIVTPARSLILPWIQSVKDLAKQRLEELGLVVSFGKHVNEQDMFDSSTIKSRVEDLHEAFLDNQVKLVLTVIGGFNSNQILDYLDYELIKNHPKILCGYSDITALQNAIYAKTGLVTYSGPHFFNFGELANFDYTKESFINCLFNTAAYEIQPSRQWSDDRWANDQNKRNFIENDGYWGINEGDGGGKLLGGNMCTLQLLQGTHYWPSIQDSILFLEDDDMCGELTPVDFDRNLQSVIHQPGFDRVKGLVIGRFLRSSHMTKEKLTQIIKTKEKLNNLPVVANVDFGHSTPISTFPIGGEVRVQVRANMNAVKLEVLVH